VANFYLHASGVDIGGPSRDFLKKEAADKMDDLVDKAKGQLKDYKGRIMTPVDVAVNEEGKRRNLKLNELPSKFNIYDIGLDTIFSYTKELSKAVTIIVNGPMGVFEVDEFAMGTESVFNTVADAKAYKVVGGGHTSATFENMGLARKVDHISSGGGACLTFLAGGNMPGIKSLVENKERFSGCMLP
jgi:phosphoglycerate kinase